MPRITSLLVALLTFAMLHPQRSLAETYPARPIRIIAGIAPGGQSDRLARLVAQHLEQLWEQPVVVEDRPGADGMIAAEFVAQSPPDGYTLFLGGQSTLVFAVALGRNLRYDPINEFAPIGRIARIPLVLAVNANVPATTIGELIAIAKARPGLLNYGSSGMVSRFATEILKASAQLDIVEVPYKSIPTALTDLLSGRIDMMFFDLSFVAPHVKAGSLRLLGAAGSRRPASAPDLPTFGELGVRDLRVEPWFGLVAPARTPPEVLAKLRSGLAELRRLPELQQRLEQLGYEPIDDGPERFAADIVSDIAKYSVIAKNAGIKGGL